MTGFATPALATNYPVGCGTSKAMDLYNAINSAGSGGGSNTVTLTAGCTYTMTWSGPTATDGSPTIFKPVVSPTTVFGNGATIALAATSAPARFFYIASTGALTLQNLTLTGGIAQGANGAGAPANGASSAAGGKYSGLGGAVYNAGAFTATQVTFSDNQAIGGNGGCATNGATTGAGGAGIGGAVFSVSASLSISGSAFVGNSAIGGHNPGDTGCSSFTGGAAGGGGGGLGGNGAFDNQAGSTGPGSDGGYGGGGGGAMFLVSNSGGNGGFGGGAGSPNKLPGEFGSAAANGYFSGGTGAGLGGALFVESTNASSQVVNSTFANNIAHGGDANYFGSSDGGQGVGGAVFVHNGTLSMFADTLSGNTASGGNTSQSANPQNGGKATAGNIYVHSGATLNLAQTIVANGTVTAGTSGNGNPGTATDPDVYGAITSKGYNLVSTRGDSSGYGGTDLADGTAANLGALASNGGPTQTMLPQAGSAAIDSVPSTGCNVAVDQRNDPRPTGSGCDIGSVEVNDIIFRNGFESSALPVVECGGTTSSSAYFGDDFTESFLDARWSYINANGGSITLGNGSVSLSSTAAQFPFVTARSPIPASGDFSVRWLATYANNSVSGTGTLVISRGLPPNNATDNYSMRAADAWQDSTNGFQIRARTTDAGGYGTLLGSVPPSLIQHDVEYCWLGNSNAVQLWVDGVLQLQSSSAGLTRPDSIWFGNPVNRGASGSPWNAFTLYSMHVRSLTP